MAGNFGFNIGKGALLGATDAGSNLRILLLKAVDTDATMKDVDTITALLATAADEADATNYARATALTTSVTSNDTDDRGDIAISADVTFTALGGASNNTIEAAVLYKFVTNDGDSIPIAFYDINPGVPTNGSNFTLQWATDGATARCLVKVTG